MGKNLEAIRKQVLDEGIPLQQVLSEQFPFMKIAIIRGYDNFSCEAYTKGAYFDETLAREIMAKIPPNGSPKLADNYHIITTTIKNLNQGTIFDRRTEEPLDNIDKVSIYTSLRKRLEE